MSIPGDNASSNGRGPDLEVWDDPVPLWLYRLPDGSTGGVSSVPVPLIAGAVVAGDVRGMLHAVDAETGAVRWRFQTDATEVSAAAAAAPTLPSHAGLVYATGWAGLSALEAASGAERWRLPRHAYDSWRLRAADGAVYAGGPRGLTALDAETGAERWRFVPDGNRPVRSSYSLATAAVVLVVDAEGSVYGVDSAGGRLLWRSRLPADFSAESQVVAEVTGVVVFVDPPLEQRTSSRWTWPPARSAGASKSTHTPRTAPRRSAMSRSPAGWFASPLSRGHVHALDGATGAERWRYRAGVDRAGIWPVDGALYVHSGDDDSFDSALAVLDPASGAERWRFGGFAGWVIDLRRLGGAVIFDLFGHGDVGVYAIDDATGAERWRYEADYGPGSARFPAWRVLAGGAVVASGGPPPGWLRQFRGRRRRRRRRARGAPDPDAVPAGVHAQRPRGDRPAHGGRGLAGGVGGAPDHRPRAGGRPALLRRPRRPLLCRRAVRVRGRRRTGRRRRCIRCTTGSRSESETAISGAARPLRWPLRIAR